MAIALRIFLTLVKRSNFVPEGSRRVADPF